MSTDDPLLTELSAVGRWLEREAGSDLTRPDGIESAADTTLATEMILETVDVNGRVDAAVRRRRRRTLVAAVVLTAAALSVAGLVALRRWQDRPAISDRPTDPPGVLYVLPRPGSNVVPSRGEVSTGSTEPADVAVVGQPGDNGVYEHLMIVLVSSTRLSGLEGEETAVDLQSGPAVIVSLPPISTSSNSEDRAGCP
jgi:hypothetical protein